MELRNCRFKENQTVIRIGQILDIITVFENWDKPEPGSERILINILMLSTNVDSMTRFMEKKNIERKDDIYGEMKN